MFLDSRRHWTDFLTLRDKKKKKRLLKQRTAGRKKADQIGSYINQDELDHAAVTEIPKSHWWKVTEVSAPGGLVESLLHTGPTQGYTTFTIKSVAGCCGKKKDVASCTMASVTCLGHRKFLGYAWFARDGKYNLTMCLKGRGLKYLSSTFFNTISSLASKFHPNLGCKSKEGDNPPTFP